MLKKVLDLLKSRNTSRIVNVFLSVIESRMGIEHPRSYPISLDIVLTRACNLNCIFCISMETTENVHWMPFDLYKQIAIKLFPYAYSVSFCSGGEPFLYPEIRNALKMARDWNMHTHVVSNAMLITEDVSEWVVADKSLRNLDISFDGSTKSTLERIRRGANFETILKNVENLTKRKKDAGAVYPTMAIRYAVMRSNIEELTGIFKLCKEVGIGSVDVNYLNVANDIDPNESLYHHQDLTAEIFAKATETAQSFGVHLSLPPSFNHTCDKRKCYKPWQFCWIDTDGAVRFCYKAWGQPLGIFEDNFDSIWRGPHYYKIRKTLNSPFPYFPYCEFCSTILGQDDESLHQQNSHADAYVIPGLESLHTAFNLRSSENRRAFTEKRKRESLKEN